MPAQRGCLFALPGALEQGVDVVPQRAALLPFGRE